MLNQKQDNGKHGCSNCEYEGVPCPNANMIRDWPYSESCMLNRTHSSVMECAKLAVEQKSVVNVWWGLGEEVY